MADLPSKRQLESTGDNYGFRFSPKLLGGGLLGIVLVAFILSNRQKVTVNFLFFSMNDVPLWITLTCTALLGAVVGTVGVFARRHQRRKARRAER
jgi:uncharacterized integral membrane protein